MFDFYLNEGGRDCRFGQFVLRGLPGKKTDLIGAVLRM